MNRYFLSIRGFYTLAALLPALLLTGGCGSDDSSTADGTDGGQITVETGSLSKAEFVKKADAICVASRSEFDRSYANLAQQGQPGSPKELKSLIGEVVDTILLPIYEKQIDQISSLGAPSGDEADITAFLSALQKRLTVLQEKPSELSRTLTPFKGPENLAREYGLTGCAESFS